MPALLALPLGLAAGSSLAWFASLGPSGSHAGAANRAQTAARYLGVLVFGPAVGLLEIASPPWASSYLGDPPSAVGLLVAAAAGAAPVAGAWFAQLRLERGDARGPLAIALGGAVAALLAGAITWDRIHVVATQSAFDGGLGGGDLFETRAGLALALAALAILAGYVLALRALAPPNDDAQGARERRGPRAGVPSRAFGSTRS